jgi:dephospho-CoA kinase
MIIGVAGGIASGKSTLCKYLIEKYDAIHFDADKEIHALYAPGTDGYDRVIEIFGIEILNAEGVIDRKILGKKVFGKAESMAALRTAIGDIPAHFKNILVNKYRKYSSGKTIIFEAVNLFDSDYMKYIDTGWLVVANPDNAIQRLATRNQLSVSDANLRLGDAKDWKKSRIDADYIFHNDSTIPAFVRDVDMIFTETYQAYHEGKLLRSQWVQNQVS